MFRRMILLVAVAVLLNSGSLPPAYACEEDDKQPISVFEYDWLWTEPEYPHEEDEDIDFVGDILPGVITDADNGEWEVFIDGFLSDVSALRDHTDQALSFVFQQKKVDTSNEPVMQLHVLTSRANLRQYFEDNDLMPGDPWQVDPLPSDGVEVIPPATFYTEVDYGGCPLMLTPGEVVYDLSLITCGWSTDPDAKLPSFAGNISSLGYLPRNTAAVLSDGVDFQGKFLLFFFDPVPNLGGFDNRAESIGLIYWGGTAGSIALHRHVDNHAESVGGYYDKKLPSS